MMTGQSPCLTHVSSRQLQLHSGLTAARTLFQTEYPPPPLNGLYTIRCMESSVTGCSSVGLLAGRSVVSVITGLYLRIGRGIQIVLRSVSLRRKK